jgi:hypothetical protein
MSDENIRAQILKFCWVNLLPSVCPSTFDPEHCRFGASLQVQLQLTSRKTLKIANFGTLHNNEISFFLKTVNCANIAFNARKHMQNLVVATVYRDDGSYFWGTTCFGED